MKKYRVYALYTASKYLGEVEAESKEEAEEKAEELDTSVCLCYQCAREIDVGDMHDYDIEEE